MRILILTALLGVTACGATTDNPKQLLGTKKCMYGPSYWCDHISKSAECGATSWCINQVWNYMDLPEDHDDVCDICLDMVKQARDQLNSNETQEELKEVLEGSCNLIPLHLIAKECDKLVDDFIPELVEVLTSEMNPQVVCQTAGLCNSARIDKLLEDFNKKNSVAAVPEPTTQDDTCTTCRRRTEAMVQSVATGGQQQLLDRLLPICRDLGTYSDACAADVAAHIGDIHQLLGQLDAEGVCLLGNTCPGLFGDQPVQLKTSGNPSIDCDLCIHIIQHWRDVLVANTTKEEFKEILEGICSKAKNWSPKCMRLVDDYYAVIYDYLVNDLRAHTICKAIGICSQPAGQQVPLQPLVAAGSAAALVLTAQQPLSGQLDGVPMRRLQLPAVAAQPLTPPQLPHSVSLDASTVKKAPKLHSVKLTKSKPRAYGNDGLSHTNPLEEEELPAPDRQPPQQLPLRRLGLPALQHLFQRNTELCDLCEFALHELQKRLMQDATEDEITELVENLCQYLPHTLTTSCRRFVDEYSSFVITLLAQEIDPDQVCPALRLCPLPSTSSEEEEEEPQQQSAPVAMETAPLDATPGCAICEYAMNTLLKELGDKTTEREIRDGLDRLCSALLPRTVAHECQELVNTFTEELIDMIASGLTADEICITLHLCLGQTAGINDLEFNSIHAMPRLGGLGPFGMRFAGLSAPLSGLPVNSPQLPGEPERWDWESAEAGDWEAAARQPMERVKRPGADGPDGSSESAESGEQTDAEPAQTAGRQSAVCVLCEFVMAQVKVELSDNATIAEIENALETICHRMPRAVADDCATFVENYAPSILDALRAALASPDTVCEQIQLCQPQQPPPPPPLALP